MNITQKQSQQIEKIAKDFSLRYLYIFGSQARGDIKPLSDFDFAVKFKDNKRDDNYRQKLNLISELSRVVGSDNVDVVDLAEGNPIINFNIIKDGKILYCAKQKEQIMDKARIINTFLDHQFYYTRHYRNTIAQLASGNI